MSTTSTIGVALLGGAVGAIGSSYLGHLYDRAERFREQRINAADTFLRAFGRARTALHSLDRVIRTATTSGKALGLEIDVAEVTGLLKKTEDGLDEAKLQAERLLILFPRQTIRRPVADLLRATDGAVKAVRTDKALAILGGERPPIDGPPVHDRLQAVEQAETAFLQAVHRVIHARGWRRLLV